MVVLSACQTALGQYDYGDKTSGGAAIEPKVKCQRCQDARWVCENHPDKSWGRGQDECCGGAGMPCPDCNERHDGERPAMSDDFIPAFDRDKGQCTDP